MNKKPGKQIKCLQNEKKIENNYMLYCLVSDITIQQK